jgi:hypothetical protein
MQFITFLAAKRPSEPQNNCWTVELQRLIVLVAECEGHEVFADRTGPAVDSPVIVYGIDPDHVDSRFDTGVFELIIPSAKVGVILKCIVEGQKLQYMSDEPNPMSVDVTPTMPPTQGPKMRAALDYAADLLIHEKLAQVGASRTGGARGLESASSRAVQPLIQAATHGVTRVVASLSMVRVDDGSWQLGRHGSDQRRRLIIRISDPGIDHELVARAINLVGGDGGDVVFEHEIPRADLGAFIRDVIDGHLAARDRNAGASTATRGGLGLDGDTDIPGRSSRDAVRRVVLALAASIDLDPRPADAVASGEPARMASNAP